MELLIYSLIPSKMDCSVLYVNQREIGPFKINQLLKYGYEEKLELKSYRKNNVSFKMLACRIFLRQMVQATTR
jgi:hypothetical protein